MMGDAKKNHISVPRNHDYWLVSILLSFDIWLFVVWHLCCCSWWSIDKLSSISHLSDTTWGLWKVICIHQMILPEKIIGYYIIYLTDTRKPIARGWKKAICIHQMILPTQSQLELSSNNISISANPNWERIPVVNAHPGFVLSILSDSKRRSKNQGRHLKKLFSSFR